MKIAEIVISVITSLCWETEWKDDFTHLTIKTSQEIQKDVYIVKTENKQGQKNYYFVSSIPLNYFSIPKDDGTYLTRFTKNSSYIYEKKFGIIIPRECFEK